MTIKLNLLPTEYVVTGTLGKVLKITRSLGVISIAAFLIFAVGLGAFFVISSFQLRNISTEVQDLKSQISTKEQSEQQIVLLKDRIKKIKTVQGLPNSFKNLGNIDPVVSTLTGSASLTELSTDSTKVDMSINFKSNSELAAFLQNLNSVKVFKSILMTTFGFNPASGYLISIRLL